jgi:hypothetical protein
VALLIALTVVVAAPLGLLLSAVVPRELEGTLLLLVVVGLQMLVDPAKPSARLLPFWSGREIGTYAVDHTDTGYLVRGIVHGVAFAVGCCLLVAIVSGVRLRRRAHLTGSG